MGRWTAPVPGQQDFPTPLTDCHASAIPQRQGRPLGLPLDVTIGQLNCGMRQAHSGRQPYIAPELVDSLPRKGGCRLRSLCAQPGSGDEGQEQKMNPELRDRPPRHQSKLPSIAQGHGCLRPSSLMLRDCETSPAFMAMTQGPTCPAPAGSAPRPRLAAFTS